MQLLVRVRDLDERLFGRAARFQAPALDASLPRLSRAADHGVLWLAAAGLLAATGAPGRRAAIRGLVSLGAASAVVNGPAKLLVRRSRPLLTDVPAIRLLRRQPMTTSFPSGHAASAAAFATGVALQQPALAVPVGALAAGVIYSRVHTGVHYPGDVVAGAAAGVGAALLLKQVWEMPPPRDGAAEATPAEVPALPDGEGLAVVINVGAGSAEGEALRDQLAEELPAATVVLVGQDDDLEKCLHDAADGAKALGVAGGDGTISCAAGVALERELPLVVVPAGTLNHFAADLGVEDIDDVCEAVRRGSAVKISVGCVAAAGEERPFVNTFSVGVYPELVERREKRERWLGKWLALSVALVQVLGRAEPLPVEIDGERRRLWLLFAGNGHYEPDGFAPSWRPRLDEDRIDVRMVDASSPWARTRLVGAVLSGRLGRCRVYQERLVDQVRVDLGDDDCRLARDGESEPAPTEFELRTAARPLVVYRPATG